MGDLSPKVALHIPVLDSDNFTIVCAQADRDSGFTLDDFGTIQLMPFSDYPLVIPSCASAKSRAPCMPVECPLLKIVSFI